VQGHTIVPTAMLYLEPTATIAFKLDSQLGPPVAMRGQISSEVGAGSSDHGAPGKERADGHENHVEHLHVIVHRRDE